MASNGLITDLYQLTMTNALFKKGMHERKVVFDRFYRVDPSRQRKGEGSGIGLAIVKSIVEAHHGRVQVESDVHSTRFILSVPRLEKMIPDTQCWE